MGKSVFAGVRAIVIALAMALTLQCIHPGGASAADATLVLTPNSAPGGSVAVASGQNYAPYQQINLYFNGQFLKATPADAGGNFATTFTVPALPSNTYAVLAVSNVAATASFTVTPMPVPVPALSVIKSVSVNGAAPGFGFSAAPGATLTYYISVTNNTGTAVTGATVTDVLGAGQTSYIPSGPCSYTTALGTNGAVICTLNSPAQPVGTIAPGATATTSFVAVVNAGFNGTIINTASARSTTTGAASFTSNSTSLKVGSVILPTGTFGICGLITAYTPAGTATAGSVTVGGVTLTIAANPALGAGLIVGNNLCLTLSFNGSGAANAVATRLNLTGLVVACGAYAPGATTGAIRVAGISLPVVAGTNFPSFLATGSTYCFLLNGGAAYAVLSGIPTAIRPAPVHHRGPFSTL
jgi:uncharacterized repeat protein (TIGR01451 family)